MSEPMRPGNSPEEVAALRELVRSGQANEAEQRLASAMESLFPDSLAEPAPEGWAALESEAEKIARGRRRRYLVRELAASMGAWRLTLAGAAAAVLIAAPFVLLNRGKKAPVTALPPVAQEARIESAHLSLEETVHPVGAVLLGGARVRLAGAVDVDQTDPARTRLRLRTGTLEVQVPHLAPGGEFVVATADTEVKVHGTKFQVDKRESGATTVSVSEGLVEVRPVGGARRPVFVRPGEHVAIPSFVAYFADLSGRVDRLVASGSCDDRRADVESYLQSAPAGQDVGAARYWQGYCAALRGDRDLAIGYFERVSTSRTDPTRADNACARAAQLRAGRDRADGRQAWKSYLDRFPRGLHRTLALRSLAGRGSQR